MILGNLFVIPNSTRWNSWFDAIRFVKKTVDGKNGKKNLKSLCEALGVTPLTAIEYQFINEYVEVMQPIAYGLDVLQGEKEATCGHVLPSIVVIRNALTTIKNRTEDDASKLQVAIPLVDALLDGLKKRFDCFFVRELFQLAAVLHPKFKFSWLGTSAADIKLRKKIVSKLEVQLQQLSTPSQTQATTPVDCGDFFASLSQHQEKEREISHGNIELTQYLNAKTTNNLSSLNSFPNIKILYSRYNTGIPSSAPVERMFSLGGRVLTPYRTRLNDDNFEMVVFLRSNMHFLSSL